MATLLLRFRVADFDVWLPQYHAAFERDKELLAYRVLRSQDDPHLVVLEETFASREAAEALLADPATLAEIEAHGVELASAQMDWLEEVAAGAS